MQTTIIILFGIIGLIFGSFFNVVGLRVPKGQQFTNDRSVCPSCHNQLSWYELIPVISFIIQHGKCRNCKTEISYIYPLVEVITGFLFAFSYVMIGFDAELWKALLLISLSMIILVSDIVYMLIPNKVLLFFLPLFIIMNVIDPLEPWWSAVAGGAIGFSIIAIIIIISRGGMGAGDMKLFGLLGLMLGMEKVLIAFFLACFIGSVLGMLLILLGITKRKQPVPFGPYIVLATLISYFFSEHLISWYVRLIL
ncbi:prepilin peptidase [Ornithinibacillus salinisoli]|uniref:Prepilin peptidase n=1 Tax=Ornithinibacillus salinisoli TaxID=1848459 RepID=A0ABW4W462_9BACI